ncbi:small membrane A-kinase anchor protein isoform X1 [Saccopteryx leptura]|uniref:small membrane A-kinase anchor protein isoform X1 n=1 Tax=Saccopteryx leptura TaxID=249018 RepID=UPI00339CA19D
MKIFRTRRATGDEARLLKSFSVTVKGPKNSLPSPSASSSPDFRATGTFQRVYSHNWLASYWLPRLKEKISLSQSEVAALILHLSRFHLMPAIVSSSVIAGSEWQSTH